MCVCVCVCGGGGGCKAAHMRQLYGASATGIEATALWVEARPYLNFLAS